MPDHALTQFEAIGRTFSVPDGDAGLQGSGRLGSGCRVLVVEDDYMLAQDLRDRLERRSCEVIGPAATVAEALALLRSGPVPAFAILDTHLEDEESHELATVLRARAVPFVFMADLEPWGLAPSFGQEPILPKPVSLARLERSLGQ